MILVETPFRSCLPEVSWAGELFTFFSGVFKYCSRASDSVNIKAASAVLSLMTLFAVAAVFCSLNSPIRLERLHRRYPDRHSPFPEEGLLADQVHVTVHGDFIRGAPSLDVALNLVLDPLEVGDDSIVVMSYFETPSEPISINHASVSFLFEHIHHRHLKRIFHWWCKGEHL